VLNESQYQECSMIERLARKVNNISNLRFRALISLPYLFYRFLRRRTGIPNYKIDTINGVKYRLDLNELIDYSIFMRGYFEESTHNAIKALCKKDMHVIDIGANIGAHTFNLAKIVGNNGSVIAFEPMEWAFKKLKKNFDLNDFDNIILENSGLSDETIEKEEHFRSSWPVDKKTFSRVFSEQTKEIDSKNIKIKNKLQFSRLDDYLKKHRKSVDLIKIDVDGYELKILKGAEDVLKNNSLIIIMELCPMCLLRCGDNVEDLVAYLDEKGFKFYNEQTMEIYSNIEQMLSFFPGLSSINVVLSKKDIVVDKS
jgi:FkbM family methyltransferase